MDTITIIIVVAVALAVALVVWLAAKARFGSGRSVAGLPGQADQHGQLAGQAPGPDQHPFGPEQQQALLEQMSDRFQNLAHKILEDEAKNFKELNAESVSQLLDPVRHQVKEFREKMEKIHTEDTRQQTELRTVIELLNKQNSQLSEDAENLTLALRGEHHTQGNWGEMQLELALQASGLEEGRNYVLQPSFEVAGDGDDDGGGVGVVGGVGGVGGGGRGGGGRGGGGRGGGGGRRLRPDAVVNLPDGKHIVIDAKVSLAAYARFAGAADEAQREVELKAHSQAMGERVKELAARGYDKIAELGSPEAVFMFTPIESALHAALMGNPDFLTEAQQRGIYVVTPSTITPALTIVAHLWRLAAQEENTQRIVDQANDIYDQAVRFAESLEDVGKHLGRAGESYDQAVKRLSTGRGNLVRRAEGMKKLGVTGKKRDAFPDGILEEADLGDGDGELPAPAEPAELPAPSEPVEPSELPAPPEPAEPAELPEASE